MDSRLRLLFLQQIEPVSPTRQPDPSIRLIWDPQMFCQNYSKDGSGHPESCPYCPLGFKDGHLTFEGKKTVSNEFADPDDVVTFLKTNAAPLDYMLEICGGEPLLYPYLDEVLGTSLPEPWLWGMTSNSLHTPMIQKLKKNGALKRCWSWNASWHPHSKQEDRFARNLLLIRSGLAYDVQLRSTIVVTEETIERIDEIVDFLEALPIDGYQFHCSTFGGIQQEEAEAELGRRLQEKVGEDTFKSKISTYISPPRQTRECNYYSKLIAINPDGQVYPCTIFSFKGLDPIGHVKDNFLLSALPQTTRSCSHECVAPCDYVKLV